MPTVHPASIVARRTEPLAAEVGGRVVLMSVERGKYYDLDDVASDVWRRLERPVAVSTLCAALAEEYDAGPARIEADVLELLRGLADQGLVTVRDA